MKHVDCIVGARPNFVKIAPMLRALRARTDLRPRLIHTGQHYDPQMNAVFFEELEIPAPDAHLEVSGGSVVEQTARIMLALEPVWREARPDLALVVGDVNSTLAGALVACKAGVPIAHVEAGLRSFDRSMPEETNRLVVDRLASLLYVTEPAGLANLAAEGVAGEHVLIAGNVMIDSLLHALDRAVDPDATFAAQGAARAFRAAAGEGFGLVTLHRPSNVDDRARFSQTVAMLARLSREIPLVFPVHPRTRAAMSAELAAELDPDHVLMAAPIGYLAMIGLLRAARIVITDSGGVQEETTALGVPCVTMRDNTERPITVSEGTNVLAGADPEAVLRAAMDVIAGAGKAGGRPDLWDGRAAERIVEHLGAWLARRG